MESALREGLSLNQPKIQLIDTWSAEVRITAGGVALDGELNLPRKAHGVVLFAQDNGSRHSPHNQLVARVFRSFGIGTLLLDLLTPEEEGDDPYASNLRFDIGLVAERLVDASHWLEDSENWIGDLARPDNLRQGYFGANAGSGAALMAAAALGERVGAVVSYGGRPDLAGAALAEVRSPTLLIVGGSDETVLALNLEAHAGMNCEKEVKIVHGATQTLDEPGALDEAAQLAAGWFQRHLQP